ncbi:MAG TPA: SCO family protein [Candidatus Polarisedimenticolia bacterium]|nr:SCO family protein [Candidatus Polarisedimenticolia bacterium]
MAGILIWSGLGTALALALGTGAWSLARGTGGAGRAAPFLLQGASLETLGDYGEVPPFELAAAGGGAVTREDLRGRWWIADFIFTRCNGICPILSARMASLAQDVPALERDDVRFVSISVDPGWDTPEVLARYAAGFPVPETVRSRWIFLTGPREALHALIGGGFRLSVAERPPDPSAAGELITHSDRFVLVDPDGRIRGYYHGTEEASVRRLLGDLADLRGAGR